MSSGLVQLRVRADAGKAADAGTPAPGDAVVSAPRAAAPGQPAAYVETYGCQMNVADTEMVLGLLDGAGWARTDDPARADLILINTCAVREKAEERVFGRASELQRHKRPGVVLGITGCMAEHLESKVQERAPYVDVVVGPDGYRRLLDHVERARGGARVLDTELDRDETYEGLDPSRQMTGGVTGHVTIQRGCDKFCTFCVVPYTRGRERGTPPREILRQVRAMVAQGYREVVLLGQTVNSYRYEDVDFAALLRAVAEVDGLERIRFTSPYPIDFTPAVIRAMAETPKICRHVHLPLQSGADSVLERMRRGYSYAEFVTLVRDLRAAMPDIALSTDLLIGFVGETEAEHQATLRAQEELRFDSAFTFAYSEREGTYAARKLPDDIHEAVKQRRLAEVIAVQQRITTEIMQTQLGRRERVLIEGPAKRGDQWMARTAGFKTVIIPRDGLNPGDFCEVDIDRATSATLFGRVV